MLTNGLYPKKNGSKQDDSNRRGTAREDLSTLDNGDVEVSSEGFRVGINSAFCLLRHRKRWSQENGRKRSDEDEDTGNRLPHPIPQRPSKS
jgi:hypothetical protein